MASVVDLNMEDDVPVVFCSIAGSKPMPVLADTGAACAIIAKHLVDSLAPENRYPRSTGTTYRLHYANNDTEETSAAVVLPVVVPIGNDKWERSVSFIIASRVNGDVLLGRSALRQLGIRMQLELDPQAMGSNSGEAPLEPIPVTVNTVSAEQEFFVPEEEDYMEGLYRQPCYEETSFENS